MASRESSCLLAVSSFSKTRTTEIKPRTVMARGVKRVYRMEMTAHVERDFKRIAE